MNIELEDCILITSEQYLDLKNPKFMGQTRIDENKMYYMIWEDNDVLYKTYNKL